MTGNIVRRLNRLENRYLKVPQQRWPAMLWIMHPIESVRRQRLGIGERIVDDWYKDFNGVVWVRERITSDPDDEGQRCKPGGVLQDVIQELHEKCAFRDRGGCMSCTELWPKTNAAVF